MFHLTGGPEEASAQLISHLRERGVWPEERRTDQPEEASAQLIAHLVERGVRLEETVEWWITELYRELNVLRNEMMEKEKHVMTELYRELNELHNEMMKKRTNGSEYSGGVRTEEQRHQEGGGWSGDSHGNAQDGGGGEETDAQ